MLFYYQQFEYLKQNYYNCLYAIIAKRHYPYVTSLTYMDFLIKIITVNRHKLVGFSLKREKVFETCIHAEACFDLHLLKKLDLFPENFIYVPIGQNDVLKNVPDGVC